MALIEAYSYDPVTGSLVNKAGLGLIYDDPNHLHAVSGTSNGESFIYDDNGNMTQRNVLENTQTLTYDADAPERHQGASRGMPGFTGTRQGRLTAAEITYTVWTEPVTYTAHYAYVGDAPERHQGASWGMSGFKRTRPGNQVIADVDGDLRLYIGTHFEVQVQRDEIQEGLPWADCFTGAGVYCIFLSRVVQDGGYRRDGIEAPLPGKVSWRSYYLAGGKRIAMRDSQTDEVTWFLSDHLGSTSAALDAGGAVVGEQRYDPWGGVRVEEGVLGTDYTYTGQRSESALGLMYYVARWYDSEIAHFTQADTVVPGAGNPAAWDRYGYVENNPLMYVDPSGHWPIGDDVDIEEVLSIEYPVYLDNDEQGSTVWTEKNDEKDENTSCPEGFENCIFFFDRQLSSEEIQELIRKLQVRYSSTYVTEGLGYFDVIIIGILLAVNPYADVVVSGGIGTGNGMVHDLIRDDIQRVMDYLESALLFAEENGGYVQMRAGIVLPKPPLGIAFTKGFLQFESENPLNVRSPQAISELLYYSWE